MTLELLLAAVGVLGTLGGVALTSTLRRLSNQQEQIWGMQSDASKQLTEAVGELRVNQLNLLSRLVRLETLILGGSSSPRGGGGPNRQGPRPTWQPGAALVMSASESSRLGDLPPAE